MNYWPYYGGLGRQKTFVFLAPECQHGLRRGPYFSAFS